MMMVNFMLYPKRPDLLHRAPSFKNAVPMKCFFNSPLLSLFNRPSPSHSTLFISLLLENDVHGVCPPFSAARLSAWLADCFHLPTDMKLFGADSPMMACSIDSSDRCWCWWKCCGSRETTLILSGRRTGRVTSSKATDVCSRSTWFISSDRQKAEEQKILSPQLNFWCFVHYGLISLEEIKEICQ